MSKLSGSKAPRDHSGDWPNLLAFIAVLATGVLLIILGHMTAGGLTTACAALAGVYASWSNAGELGHLRR
jgi:hypothetical protein